MATVLDVIDSATAFAVGPLVTIAVYEGARRWRLCGLTMRSMSVLLPGVACALIFAALPAYVSYQLESLPAGISQEHLQKIRSIPEDWGTELSPEKRESDSRSLAVAYLVETGLIRTFVDIEGKWRDYCPSERDIQQRDQVVAMRVEQKYVSQVGWQKSAGWLAALVVSFLLGWFQVFRHEAKAGGPLTSR